MFYGVNSIYYFCVYLFLVFVRPKSKFHHYGTQCLPTSVPVSTFPVSTWTPSGNEVAETLNSLQSLNGWILQIGHLITNQSMIFLSISTAYKTQIFINLLYIPNIRRFVYIKYANVLRSQISTVTCMQRWKQNHVGLTWVNIRTASLQVFLFYFGIYLPPRVR